MQFVLNFFKLFLTSLPIKSKSEKDSACITRPKSFLCRRIRNASAVFFKNTCPPSHPQVSGQAPKAIVFRQPLRTENEEALLDVNRRKVSSAIDVVNGGRFSGIVRIVATFVDSLGQECLSNGSGVIIDHEHVMTVGHTIWHLNYGLAVAIAIHRDIRTGSDIYRVDAGAVHFLWAGTFSTKNDFAILHVLTRFHHGIKPMKYAGASTTFATTNASIYGFSKDMPKDENGNWISHLSYSYALVQWVPGNVGLLDHDGDTNKGASGGPVVDDLGVVIALHRGNYQLGGKEGNTAVAVNHLGNNVEKFKEALTVVMGVISEEESQVIQGDKFEFHGWIGTYVLWE
ncbi:trypsin-like cysteine/serine peptidase domain-containing protein [Rostrohypoxylon terebratum]|nr:trypsin-like cysteine/serine peptidase domain-containing protein [Rostrohypoxylon terebratum]